ncbi:MAG: Na+/H+ antiporter [Nanoarchaeota archaeon]|nr:Na+/H+ antiporter [Nanoarchaeota archaeon]
MVVDSTVINLEIVLIAFIIVAIASLIARKFNLPSTLVLIFTGLGLTFFHIDIGLHLTPELLLTLFLPALLFEGAMNIDFNEFRKNLKTISLFSIFGVLISVMITGSALHFVLRLPWEIGFLLATIITPTDPIAVLNIFKKLGISKKLTTILEGESLFNDGTSIVLFRIFLAVVVTGNFSMTSGVVSFARLFLGGIALGFLLGFGLARVLRNINDSIIQITLTTVLAYASFLIAEHLGLSGVVCSVTSGLVIGNYATRYMSPTVKVSIGSYWEVIGTILNSIVFLLIGIEIKIADLVFHIVPILLVFISTTIGRAVSIYLLSNLLNRIDDSKILTTTDEYVPTKWQHAIIWGGLHGGLSMVLALSLPVEIPNRSLILSSVFGAVFLSLVIQGMTMTPLLRYLNLTKRKKQYEHEFDTLRAELIKIKAIEDELEKLLSSKIISRKIYTQFMRNNRLTEEKRQKEFVRLFKKYPEMEKKRVDNIEKTLLLTQKSALLDAHKEGLISEETLHDMVSGLNKELIIKGEQIQ